MKIMEYIPQGSVVTFELVEDTGIGMVKIVEDWKIGKIDTAGDEDKCIGALLEEGQTGDKRAVVVGKPMVKIIANGAITAGSFVKPDVNNAGRVVAVVPASVDDIVDICGIAITSTAEAGNKIWIALI
jgi:hypothetical protein